MKTIGFLDNIFKRNSELGFFTDAELFERDSERVYMKRLALETCINYIAHTISQTEFRIRNDGKTVKDELYYRLNLKPNQNQTASEFWQQAITKMIYDNECLIIQSDTEDLLIADDFHREPYGLVSDIFSQVRVENFTYERTFKRSECIYIRFGNERLERLIDGLFEDYGRLFGRIVDFQMKKNQVRASMLVDSVMRKDQETADKTDRFLDRIRNRLDTKAFAFFPLQKGLEYTEHSKNQGVSAGVDEVNKVYEGFLEIIAKLLNIPVNLLRGDIADVEGQTRNYMTFCIDPLLKKIIDELNAQMIEKKDYLAGKKLESRRIRYNNMFDVASAVDKLRAAGVFNANELRDELGHEPVDQESMEQYVLTKNYTSELGGGDNE